jgi:hypothetical protein
MKWDGCSVISRNICGDFVVKNTNVWADDIALLRDHPTEWLANTFALQIKDVEAILQFYRINTLQVGLIYH